MSDERPKRPLPPGWRWAKLGEACQNSIKIRDPREAPDQDFLYVDISSVDSERKAITAARAMKGQDAPSRARQVIHTGDVLVATTRPNLNAVCLVPPELDGHICSTGFCVLRAAAEVTSLYLLFFVQSPHFVETISSLVTGTIYPAVRDGDALEMQIPLPPLDEQRRITARLSEQMAQVGRARRAAEAEVEAVKALPAAFLRHIFESDEAKRWPRVSLGQLGDVAYGITKDPSRSSGWNQIPYLRVANVQAGWFDLEEVLTLHVDPSEYRETLLKPGDVLFIEGNSKELVGRCALWDGQVTPCAHQNHVLRARVKKGTAVSPSFVYLFARSPQGQEYFLSQAKQTTGIATMNSSQLKSFPLPLPSFAEQQSVVGLLEAVFAHSERARQSAQAHVDAVNALPGALLEEVFGCFGPPA